MVNLVHDARRPIIDAETAIGSKAWPTLQRGMQNLLGRLRITGDESLVEPFGERHRLPVIGLLCALVSAEARAARLQSRSS
jgi:hypothetical protein